MTDARSSSEQARWEEVENLFAQALEQPREGRTVWLDAHVAQDDLRAEVESMLAAHERVTGILDRQPVVPSDDVREHLTRALDGRYEVGPVLGRGGSATVFRATEHKHQRPVVLKVLHPEVAAHIGVHRFLGEVRIAAQLAHPHILPLIDSGEVDGLLYYVMPHLEGETLRARLTRTGTLPLPQAVAMLRDIAEALRAVHAAGIVHRDLKPENVLCADDHAYLLDFGIAAHEDRWDTRHTHEGVVVGTVGYMSPEQAAGRTVDSASDVYSWGVLAREMLTGHGPLQSDGTITGSDAPQALVALVRQALEQEPRRRPASASELVDRLNAIAATPATVPVVPRSRRPSRRTVGVAALVAVVVAAAGLWIWLPNGTSGPLAAPVAVAPLANETGDTTLAIWGRMASDWITQGLHETSLVNVIPFPTVRQASEQVAKTQTFARDLAREVGAGTLVSGAYYLTGERVAFRLDVTDVARDRLIASLPVIEAPRDSLESAVREVRERLMGFVAVRFDERASSLPGLSVRPPTFNAYRAFERGLALYNEQEYAAAATEFRQAWNADTTFPVPLIYAAMAHWNRGDYPWVDTLFTTAQRHREELSEYDRLQLDYLGARLENDGQRAVHVGTRAAQIATESRAAYNLGRDLVAMDRAAEGQRVLEAIDPDRGLMKGWPSYWTQLTHARHLTGAHDGELAAARSMRQRFPEHRVATVLEARALGALGGGPGLDSLLSVTATLPARTYWSHAAALVCAGEELVVHHDSTRGLPYIARAVDWLRRQLASDPDSRDHRYWLGSAYYDLGRWSDAAAVFASLSRDFPERQDFRGLTALARAHSGDLSGADALLGPPPRHERGAHTMFRSRLASIAGDTAAARALRDQALAEVVSGYAWVHASAFRDLGSARR